MKKHLFLLNLRLFDGEGSAAADGATTGDISTPAAEENKGETKVVYGKQATENIPAATEEKPITPDPEARKARFEEMIQGEFKDLFDERTQGIINKRFKETKTLETRAKSLDPMLDMLFAKYGVKNGDIEQLSKAIQEDNSYYEEEAIEKGMTVEQIKYQKKIERENAEFRRRVADEEAQNETNKIINGWRSQAVDVQKAYPGFSLEAEIKNPKFAQVLQATGDVKTAYQAVHFDEILPTVAQNAAKKAQEATVNNIQSKQSRPSESGVNSSAGVIIKNDPSKWTDDDIDEVIRRVSMGEEINL